MFEQLVSAIMAKKSIYVIRVDASVDIGSGHVMRCLALADVLRESGGNVRFVCRRHPGNLCDLIEAQGFAVTSLPLMGSIGSLSEVVDERARRSRLGADWATDANQTIEALGTKKAIDWLIVDHYSIDSLWESKLRESVLNIMVIDDLGDRIHDCDLLLDQNYVSSFENRYDQLVPTDCRKLLGPRYALLRPEFFEARKSLRERDTTVRRMLVFFGGVDLTNETSKAIRALHKLGRTNVRVDVVLGKSSPNHDEIKRLCGNSINYHFYCQVSNMAELMLSADLAIGAGGATMWERCSLGLPTIVVSVAENQHRASEAIARAGGIVYLGEYRSVTVDILARAIEFVRATPYLLMSMSDTGLKLVDGLGLRRVARRLLGKQIVLRRATESDCARIHHWRNAREIRCFAIDSAPISYETHLQWYMAVLVDPNRVLLIGEIDDEPVGVLRYEKDSECATVSVYLVPGNEGLGIGTSLIEEGSLWVEENWPDIKVIRAPIRAGNDASRAAFQSAGFDEQLYTYARKIRD